MSGLADFTPYTSIDTEKLSSEYDTVRNLLRDPDSDTDPKTLKKLMFSLSILDSMLAESGVEDKTSRDIYIDEMTELKEKLQDTQKNGRNLREARAVAGLMFRRITGYIKEQGFFAPPQMPERGLKWAVIAPEKVRK
jgi:hypothetical protein